MKNAKNTISSYSRETPLVANQRLCRLLWKCFPLMNIHRTSSLSMLTVIQDTILLYLMALLLALKLVK